MKTLSFSKCSEFVISKQWLITILGLVIIASCFAEICPDHKMACKKGQTCCDDKEGGFECCPYENATCCSDGRHCCPEDTTCDLSAGRCRRSKTSKQKELVQGPKFNKNGSGNVLTGYFGGYRAKKDCPDKKQRCPSTYTCCKDPQDSYACCPYENAICCPDQIHCCPQGTKCGNGSCE